MRWILRKAEIDNPMPRRRWGARPVFLKFPPNFVRQLSNKGRRNCSNIGVAQVVAASWSNNQGVSSYTPAAEAVDAAAVALAPVDIENVAEPVVAVDKDLYCNGENVQIEGLTHFKYASFLNSDGSVAIHAGERLGRCTVTDAITTPIVNTSAYFFKKTADLIDFKEKRRASFEYGRYGNYTTVVAEDKISALEGAESTILMASGMCASTVMLLALVPAGGHIVTTTDCYRKTRIFIETFLSKMVDHRATVIDFADIEGLESALEKNNVTLFFTESPTNPFLRCVDIARVSRACHDKGALVCVDGTFATPLNQKALALGADIVLHSATKYIGGHNDVLAGSISGPEKLISTVRNLHHILGGALNPVKCCISYHQRHENAASSYRATKLNSTKDGRDFRGTSQGLASHPEHGLAKRQMTGFGGVVSFEVDGDLLVTAKFVDALKIPYIAPSFGGCESIVDQPAIMSYWDLSQTDRAKYGIMDNLVRFSFGVEDFEDLKADILQALETI
ncbi:cAMP-dependent protein kinase regulatory subunit Cgs1 [Orobanche hederae]